MKNYLYKDTFAVIGKVGEGSANHPQEWVVPLWNEANGNFNEIADIILKDEAGNPAGVWGAMNDVNERNKRWDEKGKYLAGCEVDINILPPSGWTKWIIPAQTYLVVECTSDTYVKVFETIESNPKIKIISTVHERYPEPGNPNKLEVYFPVADGHLFCQSCYMPMVKPEDFGTEKDGNSSLDYCCHCYED